MARYIDAEKLIVFANNSTVGVDANDIARFPTEDVAHIVHAKWLVDEDEGLAICSNCKEQYNEFETDASNYYRFYPNCGAKMDEEEWLRK